MTEQILEEKPVKLAKVYKSHIPSCKFIFSNGKPAEFALGKFMTLDEDEQKQLDYEVKCGHPHIYIDDAEVTATIESQEDHMSGLRDKIIAEFLATQAAAQNKDNDMGNYVPGKLMPGNSSSVAEAAAGGSGSQTPSAARLIASLGKQ